MLLARISCICGGIQVIILLQDAPDVMLPAPALDDLLTVSAIVHDRDSMLCLFQTAMRREIGISMRSQRLILEAAMQPGVRHE
jgi:hypothetical protein